jgi:hypothetical protein
MGDDNLKKTRKRKKSKHKNGKGMYPQKRQEVFIQRQNERLENEKASIIFLNRIYGFFNVGWHYLYVAFDI